MGAIPVSARGFVPEAESWSPRKSAKTSLKFTCIHIMRSVIRRLRNRQMDEARYRREAEFHDKTFGENTRHAIDKYYSITAASKSFYRNYIIEHGSGKRVLEYGCGPHTHAPLLVPRGSTVTGIDISPVAAGQHHSVALSRNISSMFSCVMNAELLAFANGSFGLICGTGILHHLDLKSCFREISRTLSPDGSAVFIEPLGHNPLINLYRRLTPAMRSDDEHPLLMHDFELAKRYFDRLDIKYFHLTSLAAVMFRRTRWFKPIVGFMDGLDQRLFRTLPFLRKHAWAVCIVMREPRNVSQ
jgi:SAM-dependent methyltransferase